MSSATVRHVPDGRGRGAAADVCGNLVAHRPATSAASSGMTATESDETDDEGTGVHGMKQSHEFRTRKASNPNDWLRTRLVAPEFHCVCLDESRRNGCGRQVGFDDPDCPRDVIGLLSDWRDELKRGFSVFARAGAQHDPSGEIL